MDIASPPSSKCITYWKRKVKSEYMRLRQLRRLQANMGAKARPGGQAGWLSHVRLPWVLFSSFEI